MKKLFYIVVIAIGVISMYSCENMDGKSTKIGFDSPATFSKDGGTQILRTKNDVNWWFNSLSIDGEYISCDDSRIKIYYSDSSLKLPTTISKIKGPWFILEKHLI